MATAKQRLYRTVDDRVVVDGDPDAAFLLCGEGEEIPDGYSLPKAAEPPANKAQKAPANKARKAPANKSD